MRRRRLANDRRTFTKASQRSTRASRPTEFRRGLTFEKLEQKLLLAADFGDAPAPYATLLAENGAQHEAVGPTLGALRDSEADGVHSAAADAEGADDDGVTFGTLQVGKLGVIVTVNVQNAPTGAKLDAWIDFNGDGSWGGALEHIANSVVVTDGNNVLTVDVPATAPVGDVIARFRLSTAGGLGFGGAAADGEVEDYSVAIVAPVHTPAEFDARVPLISDPGIFDLADIDGDGDVDVLPNGPAWYENNGGAFIPRTYRATSLSEGNMSAVDLDGDGDLDMLAGAGTIVRWYENDGTPAVGLWATHEISNMLLPASNVRAGDLDGDGDMDVAATSMNDDTLWWFENDGAENFTGRTISIGAVDLIFALDVSDLDSDGDLDVITSGNSPQIFWYENDGTPAVGAWTEHIVPGDVQDIYTVDLDRDGDADMLAANGSNPDFGWYENNGSETFTFHAFPGVINTGRDITAADIDGDGDLDVPIASFAEVGFYENDGAQNFTLRIVHNNPQENSFNHVRVADIDGDGDLDLLATSTVIYLYRNSSRDFGDAPAPYRTLTAEDGARHEATGPRLGATRTVDVAGVHDLEADADLGDDGVMFGALRAGDPTGVVEVNVQNAPNGASLAAWIDFNGDGSWTGPGEHIAFSTFVVNGVNQLTFQVPADARPGVTYARFRISTTGTASFRGVAANGEVEDYAVTIAPPRGATGAFGAASPIGSVMNPRSVQTADIDGDGDTDVASASFDDDTIAWYENDGSGAFVTHIIATSANGASGVFLVDIDYDGDVDVLSASSQDNRVVLYRNDGTPAIGAWSVEDLTQPGNLALTASSVFVADIDGDSDLDFIPALGEANGTAWWRNGSLGFVMQATSVIHANGSRSVQAVDVDSDGDLDFVTASFNDDKIAWHENNGSQQFTQFTDRPLTTSANGATSAFAADIDGDGDMDIAFCSSLDDQVGCFVNDGNQNFSLRQIAFPDDPRGLRVADVDGDGDLDVLSASFNDDRVAWYENDGTPADGTWTVHTISASANGAWDLALGDLDGDGDLDVVSAASNGDQIAWYANPGTDVPDDFDNDFDFDGLDFLGWQREFGTTGAPAGDGADFTVDGDVDADDYDYWANRFGVEQAVAALARAASPAGAAALTSSSSGGDTSLPDVLYVANTVRTTSARPKPAPRANLVDETIKEIVGLSRDEFDFVARRRIDSASGTALDVEQPADDARRAVFTELGTKPLGSL